MLSWGKILLLLILPLTTISLAQTDTTIILSEIMFYPASGPNEFVEVYNYSTTETVDLNNFQIIYSTSNADVITDAGEGTLLPPESFAVILEGDYPFGSGIYDPIIPNEALILKISDNAFGSSGMANTSDRPVWLVSSSGDTLESYIYSANNSQSFSDEKIEMVKDSSQTNWGNSIVANGTPGFRNSISPLTFDLALTQLWFIPEVSFEGDDVSIFTTVRNKGLIIANSYSIEIYNDADYDSTADPGELIFTQDYFNLQPGDSVTANTIIYSPSPGNYQIISRVVFNEDEDPLNNELINSFSVYPPGNNFNDVVINEIMYSPTSGEPEWIEIYNRTSTELNLKKWKIADLTSSTTITIEDIYIQPEEYVILTEDSSITNYYNVPSTIIELNLPSLNNSGDGISLSDSFDVLIDSVLYSPDWGGNTGGRSLERISVDENSNNPSNWGTSVSTYKATPGLINSITPKEFDLAISSFYPEKDFAIIGESINLDVTVLNKGMGNSLVFEVLLYRDANGDSVAQQSEFIESKPGLPLLSGDSSVTTFSTTNFETGSNYFIAAVTTSLDDDTTNNIAFTNVAGVTVNEVRNDLVINEFMYSPNSPQPEWIEIFNRSNKTIDLKNYQVADYLDTLNVVTESVLINPGEYLVFADNSTIFNFFIIPSQVIVENIPALNNSGDKLILLDSLNRTIDSLEYFSIWGGNDGISLERINAESSSTDSANWTSSVSVFTATPGYINSITQKDFDISVRDIIFSPAFPLENDTVGISAVIKNPGLNNAAFALQLYADTNLDSIPDQLIETSINLTVLQNEQVSYQFNFQVENILDKHGLYVRAVYEADEDTTNNNLYRTVEPGFPPQSIVVNEIMFTPAGGEPEWVELFNRTDSQINLNGWSITDIFTTPLQVVIEEDLFIEPFSYLVLTKNNSITNYHRLIPSELLQIDLPVLNNDIDGVILKDDRGAVIDSVKYNSDWGGTDGYSLERKDVDAGSNISLNWGSSTDIEQSTPGRINSITPKQFDLSIAGINFNPRFPVLNDNVFVSALIINNGSSDAENYNVGFYLDTDSNNVLDQVLSIETGLYLGSGDSANVTSAFPIENITSKLLTAVNIFFTEDEDTLNNYYEKSVQPGFAGNVLVINEVMYDPAENEPEWIELVNVSGEEINLKNWSVSDILSTPTINLITTDDIILQQSEYLVIAKDTSFNSFHPEVTSKVIYTNFGSLGNNEDGVIIYDFRDGIIDSLLYNSDWGGKDGYSLERISVNEETNNERNWTTSLSVNRSTPGAPNSIVNAHDYKRNTLVINEIMFEPAEDNCEYVEFLNLNDEPVNIGGWTIEDENGNVYKLNDITFDLSPNTYFVIAADSLILSKYSLAENVLIKIENESSLGLINSGELILLKDVKGNTIDSVWYSDKWHNDNFVSTRNISLERINPHLGSNDANNWSSSADPVGGTPTIQNSIFTDNTNLQSNISVSPNPFSPDDDGFEDFTIINYNLSQATSQVRVKIFDSKGRLVRTLLNNQASGSSGSVIFDGRDDSGDALRIGIYIIFLEAINEGSGVVETMKTVVVVARKL